MHAASLWETAGCKEDHLEDILSFRLMHTFFTNDENKNCYDVFIVHVPCSHGKYPSTCRQDSRHRTQSLNKWSPQNALQALFTSTSTSTEEILCHLLQICVHWSYCACVLMSSSMIDSAYWWLPVLISGQIKPRWELHNWSRLVVRVELFPFLGIDSCGLH